MATSTRAPPQATTRRKDAVVVGWGPTMTNCGGGGNRRQDYEQQAVRGSTLRKIDPVFPLPFLSFCLQEADEVSGANNELVCTMLCGLSIGSPGLLGTSTRQPWKARLRRLVVTAPTCVGAPVLRVALKEIAPGSRSESTRWCGSRDMPLELGLCQRIWMDLRNSLTCCRRRFVFFFWWRT